MKWVLYICSLVIFILGNYFSSSAPESAKNLFDLWAITFGFIAFDTGIRLRNSAYIFFPVGYLLVIIYRYFELPHSEFANILGAGLHLVLGIWFMVMFFQVNKADREMRAFLLVTGIACIFFGTNLLPHLGSFPYLQKLHSFRLSSYLIIATAGRFLLLEQPSRDYPHIANLMPLVIMIHVFLITGIIMDNFVL